MGKTNEQEREALRKIREILEGFDPEDTYIGKAFEGCVEQAEENLRNDWMMGYKDLYNRMSEEYEKQRSQKDDALSRLAEVTDKLHESEEARVELTKALNRKDDAIARLENAKNQLSEEIGRMDGVIAQRDSSRQELLGKLSDAKEEVEDLKLTVVRLKAKLYDIMTGEEVKG